MKKQTANKRADGRFAPGNKLGNRFKPGASGASPKPTKRSSLPATTIFNEALALE